MEAEKGNLGSVVSSVFPIDSFFVVGAGLMTLLRDWEESDAAVVRKGPKDLAPNSAVECLDVTVAPKSTRSSEFAWRWVAGNVGIAMVSSACRRPVFIGVGQNLWSRPAQSS